MILCHEYRFIFIKTKKTAGTSMEIALSKYCGPNDIITRIVPEDEVIRQELGYRGPQNTVVPLLRYTPSDWRRMFTKRQRAHYVNHMLASEIRRHLGRKIWDSYTKFTIVRNPWDCAVSRYFWDTRKDPNAPSVHEYFAERTGPRQISNFPIYSIDNELAVDHVIRFEDLNAGVDWMVEHLGLPDRPVLPRAKGSVRPDKRHYPEILSQADRDIIAKACAKEIELFGYEY